MQCFSYNEGKDTELTGKFVEKRYLWYNDTNVLNSYNEDIWQIWESK